MEATNKRHPYQGTVVRRIQRPAPETISALTQTYSAFVLDRLGKLGAMHQCMKPLTGGMHCCGPAITALGPDLSIRRMAINLAQEGDVLVVAAGGGTDYACFGDGTATRMKRKKLAGAVIDGATRDVAGLIRLGFPTFARGATPRNYHYPVSAEFGGVNVPVNCAGVLVNPGDVILGDDDGVVVIPQGVAEGIASSIVEELVSERDQRAAMIHFEPFPVEEELIARGYRFV